MVQEHGRLALPGQPYPSSEVLWRSPCMLLWSPIWPSKIQEMPAFFLFLLLHRIQHPLPELWRALGGWPLFATTPGTGLCLGGAPWYRVCSAGWEIYPLPSVIHPEWPQTWFHYWAEIQVHLTSSYPIGWVHILNSPNHVVEHFPFLNFHTGPCSRSWCFLPYCKHTYIAETSCSTLSAFFIVKYSLRFCHKEWTQYLQYMQRVQWISNWFSDTLYF